jgi:SOS-response transcriptional repressor, lexA|nr:MAG TPA: Repressor protein CI [Caudoviricetes sp.]
MFAKNLKYLRQLHNIDQLQLAEALGRKSASSISEWESGKYTPKIGVLSMISSYFNVDLDDMMTKDLELENSMQSWSWSDQTNTSDTSDEQQKIIFATNLKHLIDKSEKTQKEVATAIGVSPQTLNTWLQRIALPRMEKIQLLADYFGISKTDLLDPKDTEMQKFSLGTYRIPVLSTVAAGQPMFSDDDVIEYIDYDKEPRNNIIGVRIEGDSMMPAIQDGDTVVIDREAVWEDGDVVIVTVSNNYGMCKRIKRYADGIALISNNPSYEPKYYSAAEVNALPVRIIGKVKELRRKF